jgi:hypothetical protein
VTGRARVAAGGPAIALGRGLASVDGESAVLRPVAPLVRGGGWIAGPESGGP